MTFDDTELLDDGLRVALDAFRDSYLDPAPEPAPELGRYLGERGPDAAPAHAGARLRLVVATATAAAVGVMGMLGALPAAAQTVFDRVVTVLTPLDRSSSSAPGPAHRPPPPADAPLGVLPSREPRPAHETRQRSSDAGIAGQGVRPTPPLAEPPVAAESVGHTSSSPGPSSNPGPKPGPAGTRPTEQESVESDDEAPGDTDEDEHEPGDGPEDEPGEDAEDDTDEPDEPDEPDGDDRTSDGEADADELDRPDDTSRTSATADEDQESDRSGSSEEDAD